MTQTLPLALLQQAATRGAATALRYKRLGIWHPRSWQQLADEVGRLAAALQQSGFAREDDLLIISQARAEALLLALAAQWLGGSVTLLDPDLDHRPLLRRLQPAFVLAEAEAGVQQVREAQSPTRLLLFLDGRGLDAGADPTLTAYETWLAGTLAAAPAHVAESTSTAFVFHDTDDQPPRRLSHGQLLEGARKLLARERLGPDEEALAARVFAASGQARYLLTPWLSAGFCLNFPEALATRDTDRRELGPTLVLGTRESYARLELWARERLPLPGTLSHRLYHWAMAPGGNRVRRWLGHWLIRRPLLDVLGMSRLRVPLLVGPALTPQSAEFFAALGVRPGNWQEPGSQHASADAPTRLLPQSV
ncbi:AMP-binding protein [Pseudomonas sp. TH05]|uniref:AMP-binding protein n=1 Tax=unclassified Pseudomonas TaxID=196821 RepID=UPI001912C556|nr:MULTISPECIES: AMP-binding protein [unclassified Pseudomonas]MBK5541721.1 AMP-binding protein [Pseudomonas sp. TH07]MBK5558825.1 AMP-binding protein [Pseudomonas sp. TH05]